MSYKTRKSITIFSILIVVAATSTIFGNGCQGPGDSSLPGSGGVPLAEDGADGISAIPGERTASTVYANQILSNMVSCTGIGNESVQTKQEWESRKGSLSEFGYATKLTAPMMMAVTAIAGEVCNDLITIEEEMTAGQRNIFPSFDFSGGVSSISETDVRDSMIRMSLSCWQRNLDSTETEIVVEETLASTAGAENTPAETRNVALSLCTGILSSLSAIEM